MTSLYKHAFKKACEALDIPVGESERSVNAALAKLATMGPTVKAAINVIEDDKDLISDLKGRLEESAELATIERSKAAAAEAHVAELKEACGELEIERDNLLDEIERMTDEMERLSNENMRLVGALGVGDA